MAARQARKDGALLRRLIEPIEGTRAATRAGELLADHGSLAALLGASRRGSRSDRTISYLALIDETLRSVALGRLLTKPILPSSAAAAEYLMLEMAQLRIEHVRVLFLDTQNRLIGDETMTRGSIDGAAAYPREIIRRSLELGSASLILAHNHPSGDARPSRQDIAVTRQLAEAGNVFDIAVLDHLILASSGWLSLRAERLL